MTNPWDTLRGEERLATVLGLYCVIGTVVLTMLLGMFVMGTGGRLPESVYVTAVIVYVVYIAWAHMSLWTCAFNTNGRAWGYAARAYAAVILAVITASLVRTYLAAV